jgi:hypothetical protein
MNAFSLALLLVYQLSSDLNVVAPGYPPLAYQGGNVVAVIELSKSSENNVVILHAEEPFVEPVQAALAQWRLPSNRKDAAVLVVVNFGNFFPTTATQNHNIDCPQYNRHTPVPRLIVEPIYSDGLTLGGAAVLHLKVAASGSVEDVAVIQELGGQTQSIIEAVRKWEFTPARGESDQPIDSEAFAIYAYRPLILNTTPSYQ